MSAFFRKRGLSLRDLEAVEAADLFQSAWDIAKPYLPEIRIKDWEKEDPGDYFDRTIQSKVGPLNERMWELCKECGKQSLLQYSLAYARKHPERCVSTS
jgi:hypothetical protein